MAGVKRWFGTDFGMIVWIPVTLLVFGSLMAAFFLVIYRPSHPGSGWEAQAWDFFGSEQFKIAAVSIGLPLVLLLVETQFKFVQRLQESRKVHLEEQREARNERRLEAWTFTFKLLEDLFDLSARVVYYRRLDGSRTVDEPIENIERGLWKISIRGEQAVHQWTVQLGIASQDTDLLLEFINVILLANDGVTRCLRNDSLPVMECLRLQSALEVIVDRSKSICHHSILNFVDFSIQLKELDDYGDSQEAARRRREILGYIELDRQNLRDWSRWMRDFTRDHDELLGGLDGPEVLALRTAVTDAEAWVRAEDGRNIGQYEQYDDLKQKLVAIPSTTRYAQGAFYYSDQFTLTLADEMLFNFLTDRIQLRTSANRT